MDSQCGVSTFSLGSLEGCSTVSGTVKQVVVSKGQSVNNQDAIIIVG